MSNKNKKSWNGGATAYSAFNHSEKMMSRFLENPANAFHKTTWEVIQKYVPNLSGKAKRVGLEA